MSPNYCRQQAWDRITYVHYRTLMAHVHVDLGSPTGIVGYWPTAPCLPRCQACQLSQTSKHSSSCLLLLSVTRSMPRYTHLSTSQKAPARVSAARGEPDPPAHDTPRSTKRETKDACAVTACMPAYGHLVIGRTDCQLEDGARSMSDSAPRFDMSHAYTQRMTTSVIPHRARVDMPQLSSVLGTLGP